MEGCSRESEKKEYIARVNDSYLHKEELNDLDSILNNSFSRNEIIKNWIDKELLYQEAVKKGVTDTEEFNRILNNSKRQLAVTLLLDQFLTENVEKPSNSELLDYYNNHKNDFVTRSTNYVLNSASFTNESSAIRFRSKLIDKNWENAIESFIDDSTMIQHTAMNVLSAVEIYPVKLLNLIEELNPGEVSIVLEEQKTKYSVVQLIDVLREGTIPPLDFIPDEVEARYIASKREEVLREYLKVLYSDNKIEIKEK